MVFLRKYNVTLDLTTAGSLRVRVPIRKAGAADFATGSDWTPASGDVKVSKDGGTVANIGTLPTYSNGSWEFILSGTELSAKTVEVRVVDSATKAVDDDGFNVETFGHASAMYPTVYSGGAAGNPLTSGTGTDQVSATAGVVSSNVTQLGGSTSAAGGLAGAGQQYSDFTYFPVNVTKWNTVNVTGMPMPTFTQPTGFLGATFPGTVSSFAGGAVASVTGDVGGKVLGGGAGTIAGTGARVVDASGNAIAPASTALSTATWTSTLAGYLAKLNVSGTLAHTDNANSFKADVSGLLTDAQAAIDHAAVLSQGSSIGAKIDTLLGRITESLTPATITSAVWSAGTRTLTGFGTLVSDFWSYVTRTLTTSSGGGIGPGEGDVPVDHTTLDDDGDTMDVTTGASVGVPGVRILAYVESTYSGTATPYAESLSNANGEWVQSMMLSAGVQYRIRYFLPGWEFEDTTVTPEAP